MFGINYRLARARAHAARCHLMKGDEQDLVRSPSRRVHAREPVLARAVHSGSVTDGAREGQPDVVPARGFEHLGGCRDGAPQMRAIVARQPVIDDRDAARVHAHAPSEAIAQQDADERRVRQLGHPFAMPGRRFPGSGERQQRRMDRSGLELESVA